LAVLLCAVFAAPPPRPQISEVFQAHGDIVLEVVNNQTFKGEVLIAMNQPVGRGLEDWRIYGNSERSRVLLQRFDLNSTFVEEGVLKVKCIATKVKGSMPSYWGWIKEAKYIGRLRIQDKDADLWELAKGHATVRIAVDAKDPNTPLFFGRTSNERRVDISFRDFEVKAPQANVFNVPSECTIKPQSSRRQCVDRGTMISSAQVWVDNQVPYDQGSTYQGYREDCSGYVSMAWEGPQPGWTTSTLPGVANPIDQGDMQEGDVLLNVGEHVVIFGGWASSDQSQYYAFEETRPGEGTVTRVTPFPYWYDTASFVPYAYTGAC